MAVAAASQQIGFVFFIDGELVDWGLSAKASRSPKFAAAQLNRWIAKLGPHHRGHRKEHPQG
ncbi:hypothetical protein [Bauldia sp.]|uniref:hypothetical protein n=1 Tax=Bauldia sp. TaxID=2575872 RepID=UPI003BAB4D6B